MQIWENEMQSDYVIIYCDISMVYINVYSNYNFFRYFGEIWILKTLAT